MSIGPLLTLEEFLDSRYELPDAGQWAELDAGRVELWQPPDLDHGNVILNLSKAAAAWMHLIAARHGAADVYAGFDLGLILRERPDTVRFPAVSFFSGGERFAELDAPATRTVPRLVVELASSADRRALMPERTAAYLDRGVAGVWVIDPRSRTVSLHSRTAVPTVVESGGVLAGGEMLPGFELPVVDLFVEPAWWTGRR